MSANEDPQVAALREAGFDDAADHLESRQQAEGHGEREKRERQLIRDTFASGIAFDPREAQRQAEGATVLNALRQSGAGQGWVSAGPIVGGDQEIGR